MSFYRYTCEYSNETGEPALLRSITPLTREDVNSHKVFTYRYYTSESENENAQSCYVVSLGYEKRDPNRNLQFSKPYNRYSLHYFIGGKGLYGDEPIRAGKLLFVPPYKHRMFSSDAEDPLEFYYITIAGAGSEALMNDAGFTLNEALLDCPFIEKLPPLFQKMIFELHILLFQYPELCFLYEIFFVSMLCKFHYEGVLSI